jgi:hypothetical protein
MQKNQKRKEESYPILSLVTLEGRLLRGGVLQIKFNIPCASLWICVCGILKISYATYLYRRKKHVFSFFWQGKSFSYDSLSTSDENGHIPSLNEISVLLENV